MKIGIINYPTFGGSGIVGTEIGLKLSERGHEVHYISYELPERLKLEKDYIFHEVNILSYPLFKFEPYAILLASLLYKLVKEEKLDILHAHYAIPHSISLFLTKASYPEAKIVSTLHGSDVHILGLDDAYKPILETSLNAHNALTTVSYFMKKFIEENYNLNQKVEVMYNFVDPKKFVFREKPQNDIIVFSHVSNFREVKRSPDIIRAFAKVVKKHKNVKLEMIGDGPELSECHDLAISLGIKDYVDFRGSLLNVQKILCFTDVFLLPSAIESFGLAALEAMSCGIPVISSNSGGIPEVIEHNKTGLLIRPGDINTLAKYMDLLIEDEDLRRRLGKAGANTAREKFHPDKIIPQYEELYKRILNEK